MGKPTPAKHGGNPNPPTAHLTPPWKPGQSGNPNGRPKGSRNKLGEAFVEALYEDFNAHGTAAITKVREERPHHYLTVIAKVIPAEVLIKDQSLGDLSDAELMEALAAVRAMFANREKAPKPKRQKAPPQAPPPPIAPPIAEGDVVH